MKRTHLTSARSPAWIRVALVTVGCAYLTVHPLIAQRPGESRIEIRESASTCKSGCFSIDTVVIATDDHGRIYSPLYAVVKLPGDRGYVLGHPSQPATIFDRNGRFVREIGRKGQGPNEYQYAYPVFTRVGLKIFDLRNLRVTTLDWDGAYRSSQRLSFPLLQALSVAGHIYANAHVPTFELAGFTLHRLAVDGSFERSFGIAPDSPGIGPDMNRTEWRRLARGPGPSIFAAYRSLYWIDEWGLDGELRRRVRRVARWFPNSVVSKVPTLRPGGTLSPDLVGIQALPHDRLLVMVQVPTEEWEQALVERADGGRVWWVPSSYDAIYDMRIELLDLGKRLVIASETFNLPMLDFVSGAEGEIFANPEDEYGAPKFMVLRVSIADALVGHR